MEDTFLDELIEKINKIYYSQQYDVVTECMSLLGINVSDFEEDEIEFKTPYYIEPKDIYARKVIEETEKRLTEEQKEKFYTSIGEGFIRYISNDSLKVERINQYIEIGKHLDYRHKLSQFVSNLVYSLNNDQYKINFINKYKDVMSNEQLRLIISSINDDQIKLEYVDSFKDDEYELAKIIVSIKDDSLKLQLYDKYKDILDEEFKYDDVVCYLERDDLKLEALKRINYKSNLVVFDHLIYSLNSEESLMSIWDKVDNRGKALIIYKVKDVNKRFELFKRLNDELANVENNSHIHNINYLINELPLESIKYIVIECHNIKLGYLDLISIIKRLPTEEDKIELLRSRGSENISRFVRKEKLLKHQTMLSNVNLFLELEQVDNIEAITSYINYLYSNNNDILYTINWEILKSPYIETLGLDKINVIGSFNDLTKSILDMTEKEYEAFYRVLNHYIEKEGEIDWQYAAYQIMQEIYFNKVDKKDICGYIDDFNSINIDNLLFILLNGDNFGITSQDDINNYQELVRKKCDQTIINGTLGEKKDAIFIKYFGLSDYSNLLRGFRNQIKNGMGRIYHMYYQDIELIDNEEIKQLFHFVETVINSQSEEELIEIYNNQQEFGHMDTYKLERLLKNEFLKLYNKELLQLDGLKQNDEGLYEAGVDFSILATSVGAYVNNNPDNFMEDWLKPSLASQHFCASYIRNDMLGTAPVPHVMYGFTSMEPYSLLLSGSTDIWSTGSAFISKAFNGEEYLGPDKQINETAYNKKYTYNEMDFRRIQGGKKKQPDYILVFRKKGVIDNIEEAKKVSRDWNNLPIVVVDVDLCLANESNKVKKLLEEFFKTPTLELFNEIKTKVMNNRVTDASFEAYINLEELEAMVENDLSKAKIV